jgi:hypothetical protein
MVECLPNMCKVLGLIPSTTKQKSPSWAWCTSVISALKKLRRINWRPCLASQETLSCANKQTSISIHFHDPTTPLREKQTSTTAFCVTLQTGKLPLSINISEHQQQMPQLTVAAQDPHCSRCHSWQWPHRTPTASDATADSGHTGPPLQQMPQLTVAAQDPHCSRYHGWQWLHRTQIPQLTVTAWTPPPCRSLDWQLAGLGLLVITWQRQGVSRNHTLSFGFPSWCDAVWQSESTLFLQAHVCSTGSLRCCGILKRGT